MFENLVQQEAGKNLISDIKNNLLPRALLFAGDNSSGKLTAAIETSRVLSCTGENKGDWQCNCTACLQSKALIASNLMIMGPRDLSLIHI